MAYAGDRGEAGRREHHLVGGDHAGLVLNRGTQMSTKGGGGASPLDCSASILNKAPIWRGSASRAAPDWIASLWSGVASRMRRLQRDSSPSASRNCPWDIGPKVARPHARASSLSAAKSIWAVRSVSPGAESGPAKRW